MVDIGEVIENKWIKDAKITARGNLNPAGVLMSKNSEDGFIESKKLIEANKEKGRFILSAGCNMHPSSVPENLKAMVRAAETFGKFSV
jgi:uroporphyrinogen-III decarboxylase